MKNEGGFLFSVLCARGALTRPFYLELNRLLVFLFAFFVGEFIFR